MKDTEENNTKKSIRLDSECEREGGLTKRDGKKKKKKRLMICIIKARGD